MFKNSFTSNILKSARRHLEGNKISNFSFNFTPKYRFSQIDRFLGNLKRPLYQYLIGANLGVYLAWSTGIFGQRFMYDNFTLSLYTMSRHHYHTLVTYAFSHISGWHLLFNMFTLYFFGRFTEQYFGPKVLFHLYMIGALVSGLFIHSSNNAYGNPFPTVGASGSTCAILTYFIMNFPNQPILLFFFPVPAWMVGALLFFQSLYSYQGQEGVSGSGHMGGIVAGLFYYFYRRGRF